MFACYLPPQILPTWGVLALTCYGGFSNISVASPYCMVTDSDYKLLFTEMHAAIEQAANAHCVTSTCTFESPMYICMAVPNMPVDSCEGPVCRAALQNLLCENDSRGCLTLAERRAMTRSMSEHIQN